MATLELESAVRSDVGRRRANNEDAVFARRTIASREACADRLIVLALAAGGRDNVSIVVADVD